MAEHHLPIGNIKIGYFFFSFNAAFPFFKFFLSSKCSYLKPASTSCLAFSAPPFPFFLFPPILPILHPAEEREWESTCVGHCCLSMLSHSILSSHPNALGRKFFVGSPRVSIVQRQTANRLYRSTNDRICISVGPDILHVKVSIHSGPSAWKHSEFKLLSFCLGQSDKSIRFSGSCWQFLHLRITLQKFPTKWRYIARLC